LPSIFVGQPLRNFFGIAKLAMLRKRGGDRAPHLFTRCDGTRSRKEPRRPNCHEAKFLSGREELFNSWRIQGKAISLQLLDQKRRTFSSPNPTCSSSTWNQYATDETCTCTDTVRNGVSMESP
jgi:hypothetical protein